MFTFQNALIVIFLTLIFYQTPFVTFVAMIMVHNKYDVYDDRMLL